MLTCLKDVPGGCVLQLTVKPRSRRNGVAGQNDDRLLLAVTAAPTDGQANAAVVETLVDLLGIPRSRIELRRGQRSRHKAVFLQGLAAEEAAERIAAVLPASG